MIPRVECKVLDPRLCRIIQRGKSLGGDQNFSAEQIANKSMEENPCGKEKFSLSLSYDDLFLFLRRERPQQQPFSTWWISYRCILFTNLFSLSDFLKIVCFIQFHYKAEETIRSTSTMND